jgi:hypothetical protein
MRRLAAAILLAALAVAVVGCKGGKAESDGIGTFTCEDIKGQVCVGPTDQFAATADIVHFLYKTTDVPKRGAVYDIHWIAEDVGEAAPENMLIETIHHKVEAVEPASFYVVTSYFTKPTNGWPPGSYRVEVKLDGKLATTARFSIK